MRCPHASFRVIIHVLCCGCDDDDDCSMLHSPRRAMNVRCIINAAANGLIHSRIVNQLTGVRRFYILPVDVYKHNARTGTTRGDGFFFSYYKYLSCDYSTARGFRTCARSYMLFLRFVQRDIIIQLI